MNAACLWRKYIATEAETVQAVNPHIYNEFKLCLPDYIPTYCIKMYDGL